MTRKGRYGARYDVYSLEMAEDLAERDGYEILDITEGGEDEGFILVVTDDEERNEEDT
jgi:hypothetical protein